MTMSSKLNKYLQKKDVPFTTLEHEPSHSSVGTAIASKIPLSQLAKGVILEDHEGRHLMAVLPTDSKVDIHRLNNAFRAQFRLVPESEVSRIFKDCDHGAVPPIGEAFKINTIYDDSLLEQKDVYMEAGDHQTVVHMDQLAFNLLCSDCRHIPFSRKLDW